MGRSPAKNLEELVFFGIFVFLEGFMAEGVKGARDVEMRDRAGAREGETDGLLGSDAAATRAARKSRLDALNI